MPHLRRHDHGQRHPGHLGHDPCRLRVRPEVPHELGVLRQIAQDNGARTVRLAACSDHGGAEDGTAVGENALVREEGERDATRDRGRDCGAFEAEVGEGDGG